MDNPCAVADCKSAFKLRKINGTWQKEKSSLGWARFPDATWQERKRKLWEARCRQPSDWKATVNHVICSLHFKDWKNGPSPLHPDPELFAYNGWGKNSLQHLGQDAREGAAGHTHVPLPQEEVLVFTGIQDWQEMEVDPASTRTGAGPDTCHAGPTPKTETTPADDGLSSDSFITVKDESLDIPTEDFVGDARVKNSAIPSLAVVDKARNCDTHRAVAVRAGNVDTPPAGCLGQSVKVATPAHCSDKAMVTEPGAALKTEDSHGDSIFDSDSCVTVKCESLDIPTEDFVGDAKVENSAFLSFALVSKAGSSDSHTAQNLNTTPGSAHKLVNVDCLPHSSDVAMDTGFFVADKAEITLADDTLEPDSCMTVKYESLDIPVEDFVDDARAEDDTGPSVAVVDKAQNRPHTTADKSTMTDILCSYIRSCELELDFLRKKYKSLAANKKFLLTQEGLKDNDAKVKRETGLPTFDMLMVTFSFISHHLRKEWGLTAFQQYFLTLTQLRRNQESRILAERFGVPTHMVKWIFNSVINMLVTTLVPVLVCWPKRQFVIEHFPPALRSEFPQCTALFTFLEVAVPAPSSAGQRKGQRTIKYLIAVSPLGLIAYISQGWGGNRGSLYIAEHCAVLRKMARGDEVLISEGEHVALYSVTPTKRKTWELHKIRDVHDYGSTETREYVRQAMRVPQIVGEKFPMLKSRMPISLLQVDEILGLTALDKVVHVACALTLVQCRCGGTELQGNLSQAFQGNECLGCRLKRVKLSTGLRKRIRGGNEEEQRGRSTGGRRKGMNR